MAKLATKVRGEKLPRSIISREERRDVRRSEQNRSGFLSMQTVCRS